ncbi:hypothetical protein P4O66_013793 [Electrophorus voltai]|uniref:Uncharacterized protein n=1 Tax=Electrophorus voltai TaxID=2609070 RepID=A0AAD9DQW3_9TELE|nr:hypothetical protein P4O66_013793 [Electrophorus voltai]
MSAMEEEFQFATDEQLGVSKHFSPLRQRSAQELDITPFGPIPLHEKEIPDHMLEVRARPCLTWVCSDAAEVQPVQSAHIVRVSVCVCVKKISVQCRVEKDVETVKIAVKYKRNFNWDMFRQLKPRRVQKRNVPCSMLSDGDLEIRLAINSATNLPV